VSEKNPAVSVIIPTYNRADFLCSAIQSVLDQTFRDFELIVVDDGSRDNTREAVEGFTDPRIRYVYQENKGISGARNTGIRNANATYIAFLDSDDLWLPQLLEVEIPILNTNQDVGLVYARAQSMDWSGEMLKGRIVGAPQRYPDGTLKSLLYGDFVCTITVVARRESLERAGWFDETLTTSVDWDMWLRMSLVCRFQFVDEVLACIRSHSGRITNARSGRLAWWCRDRVRVLDKVYAQTRLPPEAESIKRIAYRNVYMHAGLHWLGVRAWQESWRYFWKAIRVSPNPLVIPFRVLYLILFYNVLRRTNWGSRLISKLVGLRRRWGG